jgi:hypothetical protein
MANAADNAQSHAEVEQESTSGTSEEAGTPAKQASTRLGRVEQEASAQEIMANAAVDVEPTRSTTYAAMLGMQTTQPGRLNDNVQGGTTPAMHSIGEVREAEGVPCTSPASESDLDNAPCQICLSCDDDDMLLCDLCNKAYHAACLHLPKISEGA